ncbi:DUF488 family protein [Pseudoclavibacter terrae]|uniref:DUF488 domain-containing protein n=1 Tax=Pseudoclavibacter terrae TaxID=1530195 RepID=UPI0023308D14|nr:DUF488 domain-containing protein [Pseudoclavibacter terrae]
MNRPQSEGSPPAPVFTVGHSTRQIADFFALLEEHDIERVLDVRKIAGSNRSPQFNADALAASLDERGISFEHPDALAGRRLVSKSVPFEVNAWWQNRSFHNYADHALSHEFRLALTDVCPPGRRVAIMCSEAVWWRCHRRIIADHLVAGGREVQHILGPGRMSAAELSAGANIGPDGSLTYPATA